MLSLSQLVIVGLAGSVYVAGAVFLLAGRSFLPGRRSSSPDVNERVMRMHAAPYYFPVCGKKHSMERTPVDPLSISKGPRSGKSVGASPSSRPAVASRNNREETALVMTPICLN